MRRKTVSRLLVPVVAVGLVVAGCGSDAQGKRTVTVVETVDTTGAGAPSTTPSGVTVGPPDGSGTAGTAGSGTAGGSGSAGGSGTAGASGTADSGGSTATHDGTGGSGSGSTTGTAGTAQGSGTSGTTKSSTSNSSAPKKIDDPLAVDCGSLLSPEDVKKIAGATIPAKSKRFKFDANNKVNSTGSVRCVYGMKGGDHALSLRITAYKSAAAAEKQVGVTVASEKSLGAQASTSTVGGRQAEILIRDGGLINVQYDDWTLAIATSKGLLSGDQADALTKLADRALTRVLKTAG